MMLSMALTFQTCGVPALGGALWKIRHDASLRHKMWYESTCRRMQSFRTNRAERALPQHDPGANGANYEIRVISTDGKSGKCPYYSANRLRFQEKSELFEIFVNYDKALCQWYYVKSVTEGRPKTELFRKLHHI